MEADAGMARVPGVAIREGNMIAGRERKTFASLAGAWIEQEIVEAGGGIEATAVNDSEMQQRSYPNSFGGQSVTGGFEAVRALGLADHAQETAELAVALLDAPQCPSGEMDVILDSTQVALQIHESCGHPTELDRVFGTEASFAGTSFLTTDKLDQLRYGSDLVSIDADATAPGGLGTFGYDDEGVPAQKVPLIDRGTLVGYLTSRETAPRIGRRSMGSARAWMWSNIPLIRMTNINLRPGDAGSLEDLIADTRDGIFMSVNKSWSIDDRRLNFQFGDQAGWLIKQRQADAAGQEPDLHGHHAAVLGQLRCDLRRRRVDALGSAELREGRAGPDGPRRPRRRPRAIPRREGGCGPMVASPHGGRRAARPCAGALDGGGDRGALHRAGFRADAVRHEPDPPEHAGARRAAPGSWRLIATGSAWPARTAWTRPGSAASSSAPGQSPSAPRRIRAPRSFPSPTGASHDPELGYVSATAEAERRASCRGGACGHRRGQGGRTRDGRLVLDVGHEHRRRQTRTASAPAIDRRAPRS